MMMLLIQTTLLLLSCIAYGMEQTVNNCSYEGAIGGNPAVLVLDPSPPENLSGLFLNIHPDSRAPCDGRVMAWDFCYYVIDDAPQQDDKATTIQAGIWRQNNSEYQLLINSMVQLPILEPASGVLFVCQHWSLINETHDAGFKIEKGDIVGVYVDGIRVVNVLGSSTSDANDNTIMSTVDITDIKTPVSALNSTSYSLYLKALLEYPCTCGDQPTTQSIPPPTSYSTTRSPSTPQPSTVDGMDPTTITMQPTQLINASNATTIGKSWEYYVIGGLAVLIFLLVITIIATICGLIYQHKRSKGSEPVMIKKMRSGKEKITRILMISQEPAVGQHVSSTESEAGGRDSPPHRSQNPTAQLHQPPPPSPSSNTDEFQTPPEQGEATSPPMSPPAVVLAASFDIEQLSDDDQGRSTFKPNQQKPAHTKAQKIALAPNSDLKRSQSAADALNVGYSNSCPYTASIEYPYVLHAFEVVGRSPTHNGSLPNIMEHRFLEDQAADQLSDGKGSQGGTTNFQMDTATDDSNSDTDDEPSYSYADRRHMTPETLLTRKSKLPSIIEPTTNQDYRYDEYPSAWNPTSQLSVRSIRQKSNEHVMDAHNQIESPALPSKQASSQKPIDDMTDSPLPPKPKVKPTIKPRKKLAHRLIPNHAILNSSTEVNTATERGDQPSRPSQVIQKQGKLGDGMRLAAQTSPTYMKLLQTTKDDDHRYTYLFDGGTELSEQSVRYLDSERAHPNEWCKQTKC